MKIEEFIDMYKFDKEFDYEVLTKLKENLQSLITTGIREFLKEWRSQSAEMFDSVEDMDIMVKYFNRKQKELEGEE